MENDARAGNPSDTAEQKRKNPYQEDEIPYYDTPFYEYSSVKDKAGQEDGNRLLCREPLPLLEVCCAREGSDHSFIVGIGVSTQPQFAVVVTGDPEVVHSGCRRAKVSANACPVVCA